MLKKLRPYIIGILSYTPLGRRYLIQATGGTDAARYCYGVFMRHLIFAQRAGQQRFPREVAELGPGDSIGTGLCWLIAGARRYYAFDVEDYTHSVRTLSIFDELVELFRSRAQIPGSQEFPEMKPLLDDLDFPESILTDAHLEEALAQQRLQRLRESIARPSVEGEEGAVTVVLSWDYRDKLTEGTLDLLYSQAVMEHVDDIEQAYARSHEWLRPGGMISHQIDFKSHGTAAGWDGYRAYSALGWRVIRGKRPYLINRVSSSGQLEAIRRHGFRIVTSIPSYMEPTLAPHACAKRFRQLDDEARRTAGLFVQAVAE